MAALPTSARFRALAALAAVAAAGAGAAAAGVAPVPIPAELLGNPLDSGPSTPADVRPGVELTRLDWDPLGRNAVRVEVAVATEGSAPLGQVQVTVEALDDGGGTLAETSVGMVRIPPEGSWEGAFRLAVDGIVGDLDRTRVTVAADGAATTLP